MERNSPQVTNYRQSVTAAIMALQETAAARAVFARALADLPDKIAARAPYDVLAVSAVRVFPPTETRGLVVRASVLVAIGYDAQQSLLHFDALMQRVKVPLDMLRLMSRDQLKAEFGLLGALVAEALTQPDEQPYFHAMLTGEDLDKIERKFGDLYLKATVEEKQRGLRPEDVELDFELGELHPVPAREAHYHYERLTGRKLPEAKINPHILREILCRAPTRYP